METYITEYRHDFVGGNCTAYLMSKDGSLFIHTITRMNGGSFIKTNPKPVASGQDVEALLKRTAELLPLS